MGLERKTLLEHDRSHSRCVQPLAMDVLTINFSHLFIIVVSKSISVGRGQVC